MIRRDILDNPDKVLGSFDFFNDAKDTISWLRGRWLREREGESIADLRSANAELLDALEGLVADWERCHGRIPDDHDARVAIANAKVAAAADAREVRWKLEKANDEWLKAKNGASVEVKP